MFFNRKKESKIISTIKLQIVQADFVTTDGKKHKTCEYGRYNANAIKCSVGEFLMIDIKSDNYIKDDKGTMYPFPNVISIKWNILKEKEIVYDFNKYLFPKLHFSDSECKVD